MIRKRLRNCGLAPSIRGIRPGGLMRTSFASFSEKATIGDVLHELGENAERHADMDVQYVYVTSATGLLRGVLRLRDLVMSQRHSPVADVMISDPVRVGVKDDFESLRSAFEERGYIGLLVVDEADVLTGVVTRQEVWEAAADHQTEDYLRSSGVLGGEELRSMPMLVCCAGVLPGSCPTLYSISSPRA